MGSRETEVYFALRVVNVLMFFLKKIVAGIKALATLR